jgi:hypothetical protein
MNRIGIAAIIWRDKGQPNMDTTGPRTISVMMAYWSLGFGLCVGLNVLVTFSLIALFKYPSGIAFAVGFYQLLYVVPIVLVLRSRVDRSLMAGLIASAALTFFMSAGMLALVYLGVLSA